MNTSVVSRVISSSDSLAPLALRVPAGIIFMAHGAQKLFGWFGGYGLEGTGQWMASIGLEPGYLMALAAGSAEFFGGLALLIGLLVRPAAVVLAFTMLMAIFSVHAANGLFMSNNGYEFALSLLAIAVSLAISGGGRASLDAVMARKVS
ncbi:MULTISPECIES: DoxX family protein [Halomonas]|uniref:DoxX family protein n=1 Tax=Halomonas TaxID=2745 RepID=UPI001C958596|nr:MULTISPECIES: DoxX family protein [Halomonas]MBY5928232.1 DoxX family protein [Halomonas sp. DP8Y7-3]MBY5982731.1 DoxX family protein [Halomonas sp. DP5Y7-2]MBY6208673.1 DoxX family protein [Halomonas sp. DP3Y7-2]MBY6227144.1 DoxX family protein [Halomonas sp. DP3Y7-1]MCA0915107.1 DoxX family protein [Halomonas denitrificans]